MTEPTANAVRGLMDRLDNPLWPHHLTREEAVAARTYIDALVEALETCRQYAYRNRLDMPKIDHLCEMAQVHTFTHMAKETEEVISLTDRLIAMRHKEGYEGDMQRAD